MLFVWRYKRKQAPQKEPCQQAGCGLDTQARVGAGSCSSDLQQPAVMSPLGEEDWKWGGRRGMEKWQTLLWPALA